MMKDKDNETFTDTTVHGSADGVTRREFVRKAGIGAGGLVLAGTLPTALSRTASAADFIKVGFISPLTGPLASFGESDPFILAQVRKALAGGITAGGKKYAVEIIAKDTQSDPVRSGQLAKELINSDKVDLMLSTSTPETVNPVADACEAAGVPSLSTVMPWEAFYFGRGAKPGEPSPFKWTYLFSFGVKRIPQLLRFAVERPGQDQQEGGRAVPERRRRQRYPRSSRSRAGEGGLHHRRSGRDTRTAPPTTRRRSPSSRRSSARSSTPSRSRRTSPPSGGRRRSRATPRSSRSPRSPRPACSPRQIEALGSLGYNLASGCYWHPTFPYKSPLTGMPSKEIADGYEKATGKQWSQQLGATMSLFDAGVAALQGSGDPANKAEVAKAISTLKVTTTVGPIDFTKGPVPNCVSTPIIGTQWVKAKPGSKFKLDYVITENADDKNVPVGAQLHPYNS